MLRICRYLSKAEIGQLLAGLLFVVGQVWLDLKLPDYMSDITTLVETEGSAMRDIWIAGGKMLGISLGSVLCAVATGFVAARVAASFGQRLRSLEFRTVESFGPAEMGRFSTASLITRSTNDITQIQMFITMGLLLLVRAPIMAVWALVKIAGKGADWTLATGVAVAVLMVAVALLMWQVLPKFRSMQRLTDDINDVARENLVGLRVVRAYNAEAFQEDRFSHANDALTGTQLFTNRAMAVMMPLMNTVMNGLMLAVYWIGAYLIQAAAATDRLTLFSNMVVFSSYSVQVIMAFLLMSMVFVLLPRADVSAHRVLEVLDTKPSVVSGTRVEGESGRGGTVEFRDVGFTYPGAREPMLRHVSFRADPGQTVAFIGSTGSGKSTLVNLVPRLYDATEGQVLVDGLDVREYDVRSLRGRIGYVPQKSVLFSGTVDSNVSYGDDPARKGADLDVELPDTSTRAGRRREAELLGGDKAATEGASGDSAGGVVGGEALERRDRVRRAVHVAQADEFVDRMEGGLEAPIAQGGSNVSGGQKQRLSIARAVFRHPEILVFDDSFSALDFRTDRAVREALADQARDATKLIVAQRIGTIMDADRIVVLDDGRVVGQGTHRELLDSCEVYRQIAESQLTAKELAA
ncbi:ABC transporter ATP-binding protein [uncultured Bifidobacterium sp.]|uniref:ABC transporter ATP-binding protein n=1 Tax=uncultured Bifidobacterium sp. TaxID=165187 RepID=UPI0028DB3859|nr:ABC transporter ATP-binding protein [uncultured Bifidobacterium sp.]